MAEEACVACVACGGGKSSSQEICFLNYKPEISDAYPRDAKPAFEAENPVYSLKAATAASGSHEQTLKSELAKSAPPAIFHINGHRRIEEMKGYAPEFGIQGVFASPPMAAGSQWPLNQHAMNVPLFFEFKDMDPDESAMVTAMNASAIAFKHGDNYRAIIDLCTNNSTTPKSLLGSKSVDNAMAEFALGQCAMAQNGNWSAAQVVGMRGSKVTLEDIKYLPLYMGIHGESGCGPCVGTEACLAINKNASPEARKAADLFLAWLLAPRREIRLLRRSSCSLRRSKALA